MPTITRDVVGFKKRPTVSIHQDRRSIKNVPCEWQTWLSSMPIVIYKARTCALWYYLIPHIPGLNRWKYYWLKASSFCRKSIIFCLFYDTKKIHLVTAVVCRVIQQMPYFIRCIPSSKLSNSFVPCHAIEWVDIAMTRDCEGACSFGMFRRGKSWISENYEVLLLLLLE